MQAHRENSLLTVRLGGKVGFYHRREEVGPLGHGQLSRAREPGVGRQGADQKQEPRYVGKSVCCDVEGKVLGTVELEGPLIAGARAGHQSPQRQPAQPLVPVKHLAIDVGPPMIGAVRAVHDLQLHAPGAPGFGVSLGKTALARPDGSESSKPRDA